MKDEYICISTPQARSYYKAQCVAQEFLDKVTPEYAVILTGKNSYGHPHSEVLTKLVEMVRAKLG